MFKSNQEPDVPAALGLLAHLTNDELKELLNNDGKFEDIVKDIKQVISFIYCYNSNFMGLKFFFKNSSRIWKLRRKC